MYNKGSVHASVDVEVRDHCCFSSPLTQARTAASPSSHLSIPPLPLQSPEVFFFVLLPPIIFEAGYSLKKKDFFNNIGAITLFAVFGTVISALVVGGLCFWAARIGLIRNIDQDNPMEALMFGALIAAVDPVATLSILGSADLQCNPLLYSLVFGESVLNDAVAISLFNVFAQYYDPDGPEFSRNQIPHALGTFVLVSILSIGVGVVLGLTPSFLFRHTTLSDFPRLETSLLFTFCYLCYSTGEALGLSGIMALFVQGLVLSHYNSYNLSRAAHVASEQIFATLATIAETAVFLYMGMGVFTGRFSDFDLVFAVLALLFCVVGRFLNIVPLSFVANWCRTSENRISIRMQCVLWFAGLRGAIAFALAMNMPGKHRDDYATTTLFICIFTTVVCGGSTDRVLTRFGMKMGNNNDDVSDGVAISGLKDESSSIASLRVSSSPRSDDLGLRPDYALTRRRTGRHHHVYKGAKQLWKQFDDEILKVYFGGSNQITSASALHGMDDDHLGNYELGNREEVDSTEEEEEEDEFPGDFK